MRVEDRDLGIRIYKEAISWIIDYLEDEITFDATLNGFELNKLKINNANCKLDDYLNEWLLSDFEEIDSLLQQRVLTIIDEEYQDTISEYELKYRLKKLIDV